MAFQSAKSIALIPEIDLLKIEEPCFKMDLEGEWGSRFPILDCFNMEWGFFEGELGSGLIERSLFVALLFLAISTGTGLINTFELFLLELLSMSLLLEGPQLINLDDLIIYGLLLGEASTFSLNLRSRFFIPLFFIILAIS